MNSQTASPVLPHEIFAVLVTHWLRKVTASRGPTIDLGGAKILGQLIDDVLAVINPPVNQWNRVADFVLNDYWNFHQDYNEILSSLSSRVSTEICEQIVKHFVAKGNVYYAVPIITEKCRRVPTENEVSAMIEYHFKRETRNQGTWDALIKLSRNFPSCDVRAQIDTASESIPFDCVW